MNLGFSALPGHCIDGGGERVETFLDVIAARPSRRGALVRTAVRAEAGAGRQLAAALYADGFGVVRAAAFAAKFCVVLQGTAAV